MRIWTSLRRLIGIDPPERPNHPEEPRGQAAPQMVFVHTLTFELDDGSNVAVESVGLDLTATLLARAAKFGVHRQIEATKTARVNEIFPWHRVKRVVHRVEFRQKEKGTL